ncbi:MAG TPA: YbaK/EbsC family protein [Candidatus Limnocylindrales bacterium]|nr:YbaK/EbsC family protein [Candidatus Limnocylindrales bacterium]
MEPFAPAHVQEALDALVPGTVLMFFETTTATSQQAADNIGCELGQIVKSLCFVVDVNGTDQPILVLASGDQRVDDRKIAEHYGVGRKRVRIATPDECVSIYGYPPGSVPPVGHRTANLPTFIDTTLGRWEQLYAAGGAHNAIFPVTLAALKQATGGMMMDVVREASG